MGGRHVAKAMEKIVYDWQIVYVNAPTRRAPQWVTVTRRQCRSAHRGQSRADSLHSRTYARP
jgi:hypothetical protein